MMKYFIFSSTAALFGDPERLPIEAEDKIAPLNPYGESKLMVEQILKWFSSNDVYRFSIGLGVIRHTE